jgi:alkyl sulfatase BDS1-like metallo-beta-lactamase superfamily hydrolase
VTLPVFASVNLQVDIPFDFEQIQQDGARIEAAEYSYSFNFQNPKHRYFVIANTLDLATTIYALENRDNLYERNILLDDTPEIEELLAQKIIVSYALERLGMFDNTPVANDALSLTNFFVTLAVLNNYYLINTYE